MHAEMAPDAPFAMLRPASCDAATGAVALGAAAILRGVAAPRPTVLIKRALARATFVRLAACGRDLQPLSILEIVCLLAGEEEPLPAACCPLPAPQNRPEGGWANRVAAHHRPGMGGSLPQYRQKEQLCMHGWLFSCGCTLVQVSRLCRSVAVLQLSVHAPDMDTSPQRENALPAVHDLRYVSLRASFAVVHQIQASLQ